MSLDWTRTDVVHHGLPITAWRVGDGDALGEGPLWHPDRGELFWCDILGHAIHCLARQTSIAWPRRPSALGRVDRDTLLVADEAGLHRLDLRGGQATLLAAFGHAPGALRSNDGRADPWGGFWIGTMAPGASPHAGAFHRWTRGAGLRTMHPALGVPNTLAFLLDGRAVFADSLTRTIQAMQLDPTSGEPVGESVPFAQTPAPAVPDGAAVDAEGGVWVAEWDGGRLVRYTPDGRIDRVIPLPVPRPTCPAFGGPALRTLYVTTARTGLDATALAAAPLSGALLALDAGVAGRAEPVVLL